MIWKIGLKKFQDDFSLIDNGLSVDGAVQCKGKLIVKGNLRGRIEGDDVIIAEDGSVCAELKAKRISIGGRFEGTIEETDELIILSTGNCSGKVKCGVLILEPGGVLNADVVTTGKNREAHENSRSKS
jgi:cytoskeletal protein CcmA (bactofilin family)